MLLLATGNPFVTAYVQSDWFGKGIFWGLFILSIISWTLLIHKAWVYFQVRKLSNQFKAILSETDLLSLQFSKPKGMFLDIPHPFFDIYKALKQKTLQVIGRNHFFAPQSETALSEADLGLIESHVYANVALQNKHLEKNLYVLSTAVTLGPFLGLLGTVWGILLTFSELNSKGFASSNTAMLAGLSMALATTVIGLVVAIPAIIGFNYLKNCCKEYTRDMEDFAQFLVTAIELQYRKPENAQKISISS